MGILTELRRISLGRWTPEQRKRLRLYQAHHFRGLQHFAYTICFGSNLKALALLYGTDKWTAHNYLDEVYKQLFAPLRKKRLNILEIGVGGYDDPLAGGGSLRMWRTYFPRSSVFAIDIEDKRLHDEPRIKTFRGSQDDPQFLNDVADTVGRIDLIIDDGSHVCRHVITSFETLFPRLAPGGLYIIEDTQTSYWETYGGSPTDLDRADTTMNYFRRLIDAVNQREIAKVNTQYSPTLIEKSVFSISFYEKMIILRKSH
jgi:hypothetical protein